MWKNWKKKVSDFFYEDVYEEVEVETSKVVNDIAQPKMNNSQKVHTKMTYEYPKKQKTPFRFPVIPDEHQVKDSSTQMKRQNDSKPKVSRRRPSVRSNKRLLIHGYNDERKENELEDVPAYLRRRKEKTRAQEQRAIEHKEEKREQIDEIEVSHTKPDELDRVFKIRDGIISDEIDNEKENASMLQDGTSDQKEKPFFTDIEDDVLKQIASEKLEKHETFHEETNLFSREHPLEEHKEKVEEPVVTTAESVTIPNHLLNDPFEQEEDDSAWLADQQALLEQTLIHFNVDAKVINVTQGPSVTRFEIQPALGVKVSRIRNLTDDIKLNMAAKDIRMEAPIPGKNAIGIEVPNQYPQAVHLQEIIEAEQFQEASSPLTIALGLTIEGKPLITDISKMPHGLIAGATGSGKSVCINTILLSLLYKANHQEVKFLLIDPKMVELTPYNGIPHLIAPVITDAKAATMALKWAVDEMEDRYEKFVASGVRNITKYNEKMEKQNQHKNKLPYIVIVIDELADLMIVSPQEVEDAICRIAQKARACGMHLLLATQRPSVDVITGLIKANIPTRIAFSVSSQVDSRTMIDTAGAEKLLGKGDMLFVENGANKSIRLQGPFVSDEEIDRVANYMRSIAAPNYLFEQEQLLLDVQSEEEDELLTDVISFVVENDQASTSLLQRRFRIGYNRAARLIDTLEDKGIVSAQNGSKPREILITKNQIEQLL